MKHLLMLLSLVVALFYNPSAFGADKPPAADAAKKGELFIVVVEMLSHGTSGNDAYDRIDRIFSREFEKQDWPLKVNVERFAANTPDHDMELRVFYQGTRREEFDDLTFRAWVTLTVHGKKHDFGILRFSYYPRPGESMDDALDKAFRGGADLAVEKAAEVLYPKTDKKP